MGFSDFFKKKNVPKNNGKKTKKVYFFEFPSIPGKPIYEITENHTLGSSEGEWIINAPDISGKHLTIKLNGDAVSLFDHNSIKGTFINNVQIKAGQEYFIKLDDKIRLGNIPVVFNYREEANVEENLEPPPVPKAISKTIEAKDIPITIKKDKKSIVLGDHEGKTTTSLPRLMALMSDFFISYGIINIFYGFEDFSLLLKAWRDLLLSFLTPVLVQIKEKILIEMNHQEGVTLLFQEIENYLNQHPMWIEGIGFVIFVRIICAFVFGVTISQFLMGMRGSSQKIWRHFGGALREIFGFILSPFLIFDIPTLLGFRSFKEIISVTRIYTINPWFTSILTPFILSLTAIFFIISPLYKSFEAPIQVKMEMKDFNEIKSENLMYSQFFQMSMVNNPDYIYIPQFEFKLKEGDLNFYPTVIIYDKVKKNQIKFKLSANFSMGEIFLPLFEGNPLAEKKYPMLSTLAYASDQTSNAFKLKITEIDNQKFKDEFKELMESYNKFELTTIHKFIMLNGPFLRGYRDFLDRFYSFIDKNNEFQLYNNRSHSHIAYLKNQNSLHLIPIDTQGRRFEILFKSKEDNEKIFSEINFFNKEKPLNDIIEDVTTINIFELIDSLSIIQISESRKNQYFQQYYNFYFELAQNILRENNETLKILFQEELKQFKNLIEELIKFRARKELSNEVLQELVVKFQDLEMAFNNNDRGFFQLEIEI
jgi:hypothetical protein